MRARLILMADGVEQETIDLGAEPLIIGRDKGDITIDDVEISSTHCQILLLGDAYSIIDLNSSNGTFLNGQRIIKSKLTHGDRVRLGNIEFSFILDSGAEPKDAQLPMVFDYQKLQAPATGIGRALDAALSAERQRYLRGMKLILDVIYPDGTKEILEPPEKDVVLGRFTAFGHFVKDDELSRRHARIMCDDEGKIWVEDLKSTNGVLFNNARLVDKAQVKPDDVIRIGRSRIKAQLQPAREYTLL